MPEQGAQIARTEAHPHPRLQILLRQDRCVSRQPWRHRHRGPERLRKIEHLRCHQLGVGRAVRQKPARRQDGRRHLLRNTGAQADRHGRGDAGPGRPRGVPARHPFRGTHRVEDDWDEAAVRSQAAQETEAIIAELQPGQVIREQICRKNEVDLSASAANSEDNGEAAIDANSVVLKVRRRKFQRNHARMARS